MITTKRIYMNEADGSPGNGAPPAAPALAAPPAAPTAPEPPAQPSPQYVTKADLEAFGNGLFANFRKAGLLKKDEPAPPTPQPSGAPATQSLSAADVEAMLERERVVTRVATEHKLTDAQVKRMKGLLTAEKPEDVSTWVSSFVTDMGFVRPATETQTTIQPVTVTPSQAPISDRGSPAPAQPVGWRLELAQNPLKMSAGAKQAMDAELGADKARKQRLEAAQRFADMPVRITNQG